VGSGGAAFSAAIEACAAGASVTMIECEKTLGGASIISGGGCFVVDSPLQKSLGYKDSPEMAFEDWVKRGQGSADEIWVRFYIEHSLHDIYFWAESLGAKWADMKFQEGNRVPRWHRCDNNGLGIMTVLMKAARANGLKDIHTATEVTDLIIQNGTVKGIKGVNLKSGTPLEILGNSVVVATGGFCSNLDMIYEARPDLKGSKIMIGSGAGATGKGHKLIQAAGGYLTHMDHLWLYVYATPDYRDPMDRRGLVFRHTPGFIWVNQQGRRFHNENLTGAASATPALLSQYPRHAWAVLDTPMTAKMEVADPYYRDGDHILREKIQELLDNSPFIRKAESLAELGRKMDVDVPTFLSTVENYNIACNNGLEKEPEFGKILKDCKKFDTPPFYAIQLFLLARKSFGGAKTDLKCRVLNKYFDPIPGLYAAGEVAGMAGGHINGRAGLEGTMLGPSLFSGRIAGAWAAAEVGCGTGFIGKPHRP
jgi:flavocytochrome c